MACGRRDPADILAAVESNTAVHAALGRLSSPLRQMVALAFFRGLTHDEIAAHSGVPLGTGGTVNPHREAIRGT